MEIQKTTYINPVSGPSRYVLPLSPAWKKSTQDPNTVILSTATVEAHNSASFLSRFSLEQWLFRPNTATQGKVSRDQDLAPPQQAHQTMLQFSTM